MNGREWPCSFAEYLALDAESSGRVTDFLDRPALYRAKHITKAVVEEQTAAMALGSAIHCLVLEGREVFDERYAVGPVNDKRATAWKKWAETEHRHALKPSESEIVEACLEALTLHEAAHNLLFAWEGTPELSGTWEDDETGLLCKFRMDKRVTQVMSVAELKSSRSCRPEDVERGAVSSGHHIRGAWYVDGHREVYGVTPNSMVFVTVDTELDPKVLEDRVYVWTLTPALEELGARRVRTALDGIKACRASGVWRADWSQDVHAVDVPRWLANAI